MRYKEMCGYAFLYLLNVILIWTASIPQITTCIYAQACKTIHLSPSEDMMSHPLWTFLSGIWSSLCIFMGLPGFIAAIAFFTGMILPFFYAYLITLLMFYDNMRLLKNKIFMTAYFISFFIYIPAGCLGHVKFLYWTTY